MESKALQAVNKINVLTLRAKSNQLGFLPASRGGDISILGKGNNMDERMLKSAQNGERRQGKKELIAHLTGKRLTQRQAIKANCYCCNSMGESDSCEIEECALLPYSPYKAKQKKIPTDPTFMDAPAKKRANLAGSRRSL